MSTEDQQFITRAVESAIRIGLVAALVVWTFEILQPFLSIMVWAIIIAVAAYPAYRGLAAHLGNRHGLAGFLYVVIALSIVVVPSFIMAESLVQSAQGLSESLERGAVDIPDPKESVKEWPMVGEKVYAFWSLAADNLEVALTRIEPQLQQLRTQLIETITSTGKALLQFVVSIIISAILLANAEAGASFTNRICTRLAPESGPMFATLTEQTMRGVAMGVIGVALIQAILSGIGFVAIGVPGAGAWALLVLMLGIIQLPPTLVIIPVILWVFPNTELVPAIIFTVYAMLVALSDNFLKPILMGRGVDAPMLVIFLGAIGGFITGGFIGLFVGAVIVVLAYQLFMAWLAQNADPASEAEEVAGP